MTYKFVVGKKYATLEAASKAASEDYIKSGCSLKKAHAMFDAYKRGEYIPSTERNKEPRHETNGQ